MDFYTIKIKDLPKEPGFEVYPDFVVGRSKDLMIRGKAFYAVWDEKAGLWSTDEYDVQRLVDEDLQQFAEKAEQATGVPHRVRYLRSFNSNSWSMFRKFVNNLSDNSHQLDSNLTFANTEVKKEDYVSRRLPYALAAGDYSAWDELVGTLYSVEERAKIEWAIGAVVSGDSKSIQKFLVMYGPPGTGKGTILDVILQLFGDYTVAFDAKALGSNGSQFATEAFKNNPLVAIQQDGDLSRIEDNARLNSIISHEYMLMNEKYKSSYTARVCAFLFMGTNKPVKISDAKSGIIRRLIDVNPTGVRIPENHYEVLKTKISFQLGAIAQRCLDVYLSMGKHYYNTYRPLEMMFQTDVFFNFIEANFDIFKSQDSTTLKQAYVLYKEFCNDSGIDRVLPMYKIREELRNYFDEFEDRHVEEDGSSVRSYYSGFNANKFKAPAKDDIAFRLVIEETESLLDKELADAPAQYANEQGNPKRKWANCGTTLSELDTSQLHFVKVPENHIVIDFDLKDADTGEKSLERNLEAAAIWPATYAELSQSGSGVHLHYIYDGPTDQLRSNYSDGIEVKTLLGDASLRRRLSLCNGVAVATINSGLPLKEEKKLLTTKTVQSEKGLRDLIIRNLQKEIHPGTKPSVDFIAHILDEANAEGLVFDVRDMRPAIMAFANNSTNQSLAALKVVQNMKFVSDTTADDREIVAEKTAEDDRIVFFDIEVYPNLCVVCWKYDGAPDETTVKMINPTAQDIEKVLQLKLVGFNCRRYDNHILYGIMMGYNNEQLYKLSQKIINKSPNAFFGEAYNLSYADIYEFASIKQSLKKWEIDLGLHHQELDIPWDQPVPEERFMEVVEYCCNDVIATEATFHDREQDFVARLILAELSGLSVNSTTQQHAARIIFGKDRDAQSKFVYTDLSKEFPGYVFENGTSIYRGEVASEGGYVYSEPGIWENVALLDIASMHPTSIENLNLFGPYTKQYSELKQARMAIKNKDYETAQSLFSGRLAKFVRVGESNKALSDALKIVINIVYGLTSAKFDNPFRDVRNIDNIVAKRGALFMIDLKHFVQEQGFTVAHIKTDSIKIPNATPEIIEQVMLFGEKYGYTFEHEATYDKFCLVNDAVYIARAGEKWNAVGAQFQHPYVFKTMFSNEPIEFADLCETKQVSKGAMYLDFEHDRPAVLAEGMQFVGRTGLFVPVTNGGGVLYRVFEDKSYAVAGTKGYFWVEAEMFKKLGVDESEIDMSYFEKLADEAKKTIEKFGSYEELVAND